MKSCDQSRDGSNLIGTISDHPASWGWLSHQSPDHLTFQINLLTFGSTFRINFLNQPMRSTFSLIWRRHWIVVCRFFWQTYVRGSVFLSTEVRMIQVVHLLADHLLVEAWSILPSSTLWWRRRWKPYWTQLGLLPGANISSSSGESEWREWWRPLGSRLVAPRLDEYVGLDLTWSDAETSIGARLESWSVLRMMKMYQDNVNNEAIGIEAEVEIDVWRLRYAMAWRPDCT